MEILRVDGLSKSFEGRKVLKNLSFSMDQGSVVSVLGKSGSGKTTLLRCLAFLERADSGKIVFDRDEVDLTNASGAQKAAIRRKSGFVFQSFNLFANHTALENVILGLVVGQRMKREQAEKRGMELLSRVGLADKRDFYPIKLSGGQQQRVAIARALATDPKLIYFDEPTSALDPELTGEVLDVIRRLAADGMTMLIVTHEMAFAKTVSDRIFFMDGGELAADMPAGEFFAAKDPRIKGFLGYMK